MHSVQFYVTFEGRGLLSFGATKEAGAVGVWRLAGRAHLRSLLEQQAWLVQKLLTDDRDDTHVVLIAWENGEITVEHASSVRMGLTSELKHETTQ